MVPFTVHVRDETEKLAVGNLMIIELAVERVLAVVN